MTYYKMLSIILTFGTLLVMADPKIRLNQANYIDIICQHCLSQNNSVNNDTHYGINIVPYLNDANPSGFIFVPSWFNEDGCLRGPYNKTTLIKSDKKLAIIVYKYMLDKHIAVPIWYKDEIEIIVDNNNEDQSYIYLWDIDNHNITNLGVDDNNNNNIYLERYGTYLNGKGNMCIFKSKGVENEDVINNNNKNNTDDKSKISELEITSSDEDKNIHFNKTNNTGDNIIDKHYETTTTNKSAILTIISGYSKVDITAPLNNNGSDNNNKENYSNIFVDKQPLDWNHMKTLTENLTETNTTTTIISTTIPTKITTKLDYLKADMTIIPLDNGNNNNNKDTTTTNSNENNDENGNNSVVNEQPLDQHNNKMLTKNNSVVDEQPLNQYNDMLTKYISETTANIESKFLLLFILTLIIIIVCMYFLLLSCAIFICN
uniref:PiggyBac transposable element n=1 Tax=Trachysalambria curvirostris majanivirus TaxID=2984281 RepID=A0A9C7EYW4_9VIRU|nr:MAG: piggyBac transposable element [Trachysalambria curvirostris majanivirus]